MYAIIDIETTGLNAKTDRITEIAIYIHDGSGMVDHFESLVNPSYRIPYNVSMLTGITNEMVEDAPHFYEVAKKIVQITEGCTIVAHNASFDYNFLRYEFKRLFYDYKRKTLCTKKLSQKLIPDQSSYGLGKLCRRLGIPNHARHRAGGDALSTVKLFEHLMRLDSDIDHVPLKDVRSNIPMEEIDNLPEAPGVYYFLDEYNDILYIGKSVNIRQRVISHLNNNVTKRAIEMRDRSFHITCQLTGNDLVAQLLESSEIKKYKPVFNRSLRRNDFSFGLFSHTGKDSYIRLTIERIKKNSVPLTAYTSKAEGKNHLSRLVAEFELCQKLCGLYECSGACFHYQIGECKGACVGKEEPSEYNDRVIDAISRYSGMNKSFFILDDGRNEDELSVVKVQNGRFVGLGYLDENYLNGSTEILHDAIATYEDNRDARMIIGAYLRKNEFEKVILF
jgi:DNA polymerase-3 subunit epsilon